MAGSTPTVHARLAEINAWLQRQLGGPFPPETNGLWSAGDGREIHTLGIAREGSPAVAVRAVEAAVDALLLHRPWHIGPLPDAIGILVLHEALDVRLTTGHNPWLAARLGFRLGEGIGERDGWPLVTLASRSSPLPLSTLLTCLEKEIGGPQLLWNRPKGDPPIGCIALANAMRPALVTLAARKGAGLYVTGTLRPAARETLDLSGMAAVATGHAATEQWGLRWLARRLARRFGLRIVSLDGSGYTAPWRHYPERDHGFSGSAAGSLDPEG